MFVGAQTKPPTPPTEGGMGHPREDISETRERGMGHPPTRHVPFRNSIQLIVDFFVDSGSCRDIISNRYGFSVPLRDPCGGHGGPRNHVLLAARFSRPDYFAASALIHN
jgi:hypothetical protein